MTDEENRECFGMRLSAAYTLLNNLPCTVHIRSVHVDMDNGAEIDVADFPSFNTACDVMNQLGVDCIRETIRHVSMYEGDEWEINSCKAESITKAKDSPLCGIPVQVIYERLV